MLRLRLTHWLPLLAISSTGCFDLLGLGDYKEGGLGGGGALTSSTSTGSSTTTTSSSSSSGTTSSSGTGGAPECTVPTSEPCYSGAAGTKNVGVCREGVRDCDATGHFGACVGEVVPTMENCQTFADESCSANCGEYVAHRAFFANGEEYFDNLGLASNEDLLIIGNTSGGDGLDLGGGPLSVPNDYEIILARLTPTFGHVWSKAYPFATVHSAFANGSTIGVDGLAGTNVTVGGTAFTAGDRMIVRIDASTGGVTAAAKNTLAPYVIAGSPSGYFFEAAKIGLNDALVRRNGVTIDQTLTLWPASTQVHISGIEGFSGGAFVYGEFSGTLSVGSMSVTTTQSDGFILKTVNGAATALVQLHANGSATVRSAAFAGGDLYVVGSFTGTLPDPLSGQSALSQSGTDFYIARLQSAGSGLSITWAKGFPGAGDATPGPLAVDPQGFVTTSTTVGGDSNFGGGVLSVPGPNTRVLASHKSDGSHAWSRALSVWPSGLVANAMGRLFLTAGYSPGAAANFSGKNLFGSGIDLQGAGGEDALVAELFSAAP